VEDQLTRGDVMRGRYTGKGTTLAAGTSMVNTLDSREGASGKKPRRARGGVIYIYTV